MVTVVYCVLSCCRSKPGKLPKEVAKAVQDISARVSTDQALPSGIYRQQVLADTVSLVLRFQHFHMVEPVWVISLQHASNHAALCGRWTQ